MERLLKDCLLETADESGLYFTRVCTHCGGTWSGQRRFRDKTELAAGREAAAEEAAKSSRVCNFCGQVVCSKCFVNVDGIQLCVQCGSKLKSRLEQD